jgi:predicted Zn-dependent protease
VTATHEIGHILGLSHSDVTDAIMNPFYVEMLNGVELQLDDIAGIQRLYGKLPFKKLFIHPLVPPNTHQ